MTRPVLFWFRRDLRLADNPALVAAAQAGPVIPVAILDPGTEALGTAPKWRLGESLAALGQGLGDADSRLILRRGDPLEVLRALIDETGARAVHWSRLYDPAAIARDKRVKAALTDDGIDARSHAGHLLFEPWTVETGTGGFYKVYTPFWKSVRGRDPGSVEVTPKLSAPSTWPKSDSLGDWALGKGMDRGGRIVAGHARVGESAARGRLGAFIANGIDRYAENRDRLDEEGTSGLSENLTVGEISARTCWHAGWRAMEEGRQGAETFLKELVWRDFAYHLIWHTPRLVSRNWREEWDAFPWREADEGTDRWRRGMTGEPVIDAAMRQMYVSGTMHNRARMLVASYLTKHLMTDWRVGQAWFEDCLIDWDPASNAMGWQWAAGSGPDAAPFFRIFNPATQAEKFDPDGAYRRRWVAELADRPGRDALDYFDAVPRSWGLSPEQEYPDAMVDLKGGRERALDAYRDSRA